MASLPAQRIRSICPTLTFSHIIHGFAFYGLLWLAGRRWPLGVRLVAAVFIESAWEVFENTNFVINRYRESTISLDYYGDSVLNSVSDIAAMIAGFLLASRLPIAVVVVAAVVMEVGVAYADPRQPGAQHLDAGVLPLDAVRRWQLGG